MAAYSPRMRPGTPVSFPVAWEDLDRVVPTEFTVHTAVRLLGEGDPWVDRVPGAAAAAARPDRGRSRDGGRGYSAPRPPYAISLSPG